MKMKRFDQAKVVITLLLAILAVHVSRAEDAIEVPVDELAQESVYPIFDRPLSVKNRNVVTEGRFDVGLFWGMALTEPIYNVNKIGFDINYHVTENYSLGVLYTKNNSGLSSYATQLYDKYQLDFTRSPYPEMSALLDWNIKFYYGKMSLTKQTVFNTSLYGSLAGGVVKYVHKSYPAIAAGLGTRFYFSSNCSLKADLRLYAHNAPIPFLRERLKTTDPVPAYSDFDERITYTTNLDIGLNWLF